MWTWQISDGDATRWIRTENNLADPWLVTIDDHWYHLRWNTTLPGEFPCLRGGNKRWMYCTFFWFENELWAYHTGWRDQKVVLNFIVFYIAFGQLRIVPKSKLMENKLLVDRLQYFSVICKGLVYFKDKENQIPNEHLAPWKMPSNTSRNF